MRAGTEQEQERREAHLPKIECAPTADGEGTFERRIPLRADAGLAMLERNIPREHPHVVLVEVLHLDRLPAFRLLRDEDLDRQWAFLGALDLQDDGQRLHVEGKGL